MRLHGDRTSVGAVEAVDHTKRKEELRVEYLAEDYLAETVANDVVGIHEVNEADTGALHSCWMPQLVSFFAERMVAAHSAELHWIYLHLRAQPLRQLDLSW